MRRHPPNRKVDYPATSNADGTARLAAADADEWAGEGVLTVIYRIRGCP